MQHAAARRAAGAGWPAARRGRRLDDRTAHRQHPLQPGTRRNEPVQSDLDTSCRSVVGGGRSDHADSFSGLATTADLVVRSWAVAFDDVGSQGHILNKVRNRRSGRWVVVDMRLSIVFANEGDRPQPALDPAGALPAGRAPRMLPVRAQSSLGFGHIVRTMACGQHGLRLWYPRWGNPRLAFDGSPAPKFVDPLRRSAAPLALIAAGAHPSIRVMADSGNPAEREAA